MSIMSKDSTTTALALPIEYSVLVQYWHNLPAVPRTTKKKKKYATVELVVATTGTRQVLERNRTEKRC